MFFNNQLFEPKLFLRTLVMFLLFSLASSAVYCFNDIFDIDYDRQNPLKCSRPLASGAVSLTSAMLMAAACLVLTLVLLLFLCLWTNNYWLIIPVGFYLVLNIAYTACLKHHAIVDVGCIALGFVLRVVAGGLVTSIWVSHWIIIMTFLFTLFLALAKRLGEIEQGSTLRKSMSGYNITFVYTALSLMASVIIVCYILYTLDNEVIFRFGTPYLYATSIWVLAGLLRYLQLIIVFHRKEGPTTLIFSDFCLIAYAIGWFLCFAIIIYVI
jgi:4-hydroxybenzoate polyprenyltransferase